MTITWLIRRLSLPGKSRRRLMAAVATLSVCLLFPLPLRAELSSEEFALKAAFIFNFAKFVEWPESVFRKRKEFCIGLLGRTPLERELSALKGRSVNGRPVAFHHLTSAEDAAQCQVVFISRSQLPRLQGILDSLAEQPVLTVSDSEEFCKKGGMLALDKENGKLVFDANYREFQRARLKPNSQMLKLARKVYGRPFTMNNEQ